MNSNQLIVEQADYYRYKCENLNFDVFGGVDMERLDSLRTTLKLSYSKQTFRYTLDLYHGQERQKLINTLAAKFTLNPLTIEEELEQLTEVLEKYRLSQTKIKVNTVDLTLTKAETKEAEDYLKQENLIENLQKDIEKSGVVGEETNRLLMYLTFTSRKMKYPLNCISIGSQQTGKTYLQSKIADLMPEEDIMEMTSLTPNCLYYFKEDELQNKLLLLEDLEQSKGALFALSELQAKGSISKNMVIKHSNGRLESKRVLVRGPIVMGACTSTENNFEANAEHSFLLYSDESNAQDQKVMAYQRDKISGKIDEGTEYRTKEKLKNLQRVLKPVSVYNPYADQLTIPQGVLKPRRTNKQYLQFINIITYLHQYQRTQQMKADGEVYIETSKEDIEIANKLLTDIFIHKSDILTGNCRSFFEKLKTYLKANKQNSYTSPEIRRHLKLSETTLRRYHHQLLNVGYITIAQKQKRGYRYQIENEDFDALKKRVTTELETVLLGLSAPLATYAPPARHKGSGALQSRQTVQ